jgi:signal transduction histidine kinase
LDQEGTPRAVASRRVYTNALLDDLPEEAKCLRPLIKGFSIYQGFLIDTTWLLKDLPWEIEERLLDKDMVLRVPFRGHPIDVSSVFEPIDPIRELEFETADPDHASYSRLEVSINTDRIEERIQLQSRRFFTVALMLVVTLGIGLTLLYRSVRRELEHARRMQNFVAAVTHELRTPVSTIRLHAEMLLDGWAADPVKQKEYFKRIVRETDRLSVLVERVLEKSRIKESVYRPVPGDLNEIVATLAGDLAHAPHAEGPSDDLAIELTPELPPVWLTPEAITGILTNLIENARKYAPATKEDPILVRTKPEGKRVLLQVLDRGPGVPQHEREKIFDAFYRVGSEATRTTTGTGLGLHLVRIHADSCRARVAVLEREAGGSIFQVAFESAPASAPPSGSETGIKKVRGA